MNQDTDAGLFASHRFWQGWAVAATLAALCTFIFNLDFASTGRTPDYVAIIGEADLEPMWVMNANLGDGVVNVRAANAAAPGEDQDYVLWVWRQDYPQRVGVLPVNREREVYELSREARSLLVHGQTVGVSREARQAAAEGQEDDAEAGATPPEWLHTATIARL